MPPEEPSSLLGPRQRSENHMLRRLVAKMSSRRVSTVVAACRKAGLASVSKLAEAQAGKVARTRHVASYPPKLLRAHSLIRCTPGTLCRARRPRLQRPLSERPLTKRVHIHANLPSVQQSAVRTNGADRDLSRSRSRGLKKAVIPCGTQHARCSTHPLKSRLVSSPKTSASLAKRRDTRS